MSPWSKNKVEIMHVNSETVSYFLHVDFNVFLEIVAVQIEHQVMYKVKAITHNDQRKLICKLGLLRKKK